MTLGRKIKEERKRCGLTQKQVAEIVGVTVRTVINWESDEAVPQAMLLNALSDALGYDFNKFIDSMHLAAHWVSVKERNPQKDGEYVCAGLYLGRHGIERKGLLALNFETDKGEWDAPGSTVTHWLEGLELPDMEGVL